MNKIPSYTEELVADLKLKYPYGLKVLEIYPDEEAKEPIKFLVKKPGKSLVYLLSSKEYDRNIQASSEAMIANCVLAGDMDAVENDGAVYSELIQQLSKMMNTARSALKNV